jgi:D-alanyl-D-alanine carboxypeptidase
MQLPRHKPFLAASVLLIAAIVAIGTPSAFAGPPLPNAPDPVALQKKLQIRFDEMHQANGFPGATLAVVTPDGKEFSLATGVANVASATPMRPNDRMLAGSIGKTFFATIFMRVIADHKMSLDDKISKWLGSEPWFHRLPNANDITVRMLMNHTSGIPEYAELPTFTEDLGKDLYKNWTPVELLAYIFDKPALFPAGQGWSYADANFIVLGIAAEKILKKPLYGEIERGILQPLKLKDTMPSTSPILPGLVTGYSMPDSPFRFEGATLKEGKFVINPQFEWAGGGFLSNSWDLARWSFDLYGGSVLPPDSLKQMETGVPAKTGKGDEYGLGVQIRHTDFGVTYGHGGWFPGYLSEMEYFPEYNLAVAVQMNTDDFSKTKGIPHAYILEMMKIIAPEFAKVPAR